MHKAFCSSDELATYLMLQHVPSWETGGKYNKRASELLFNAGN